MYPSILRRVIVIALYNVAIVFAIVGLILVFVTNICWFYNECTASDHGRLRWIVVAWAAAAAALVALGLSGRLWGARRQKHAG